MYWGYAKKAVIVLLAIINCVLFGFNYKESRKYFVTPNREKAIFSLLSDNGVSLYSFISEYKPVKTVSVKPAEIDRAFIQKKLFADEDLNVTYEFENTILKNQNKEVRFKDNLLSLKYNVENFSAQAFDKNYAYETAKSLVAQISGKTNKYALTQSYKSVYDGYPSYAFEFCETYKGKPLYCGNYVIEVAENGTVAAEAAFYDVYGYEGNKNQIVGCDEALMAFIGYARENYAPGTFTAIEKIELGYDYREYNGDVKSQKQRLSPCYKIFFSGNREPITINAYANEIM